MNNLRSFLNIDFLVRENAVKNWRMILFLSFLAVIMISSGHSADKKIYFESNKHSADLKVFFDKNKYNAKWLKSHELRGRIG